MSRNFYINFVLCEHCGRGEKLHLGKCAWGWKFMLQYNGGKFYQNWEEMKDYLRAKLQEKNAHIEDEYGEKISIEEFIKCVENYQENPRSSFEPKYNTKGKVDNKGFEFIDADFC